MSSVTETAELSAADAPEAEDRTGLPARIAQALETASTDAMVIKATPVDPADKRGGRAAFYMATALGACILEPRVASGKTIALTGGTDSDALEAAAILSDLEPLITAIETVSGLTLEPNRLVAVDAGMEGLLHITVEDAGGELLHSVHWSVPDEMTGAVLLERGVPELVPQPLFNEDIPCRLLVPAPVLDEETLAALAVGDMILVPALGAAACRAGLVAPEPIGLIDKVTVSLGAPSAETPFVQGQAAGLMVEIGPIGLPLGTIAKLRDGGHLALAAGLASVPARLRRADQVLLNGELTRIGAAHGLLIAELAPAPVTEG